MTKHCGVNMSKHWSSGDWVELCDVCGFSTDQALVIEDPFMKDVLERWRKEEDERKQEAWKMIDSYRGMLAAAGYDEITFRFTGYGDSGEIDPGETQVMPGHLGMPSKGVLDDLVGAMYAFLPGGWEDNDGSSGTIRLDVHTGDVDLYIAWNVTIQEEETRTFRPGDA